MRYMIIAMTAAAVLWVACASSETEDAGTGTGRCRVNAQCTASQVCKDGECVYSDAGIYIPPASDGGGGGGGDGGGGGFDGGGNTPCVDAKCDGCCTSSDPPLCMFGGMDTACGQYYFGNVTCRDCTVNDEICLNYTCQNQDVNCGPGVCTGCCPFGGGACQSGFANGSCGSGGTQCVDCSITGQSCANGFCQ